MPGSLTLLQHPKWPEFQVDSTLLQPALSAARLAQGQALGMARHLQVMDLAALQVQGWEEEALATAHIEGEVLQLQSVRASIARRLGLTNTSVGSADKTDLRTEATLDVLQAALQNAHRPLDNEILFDWQAALFPTGRSGMQRIVTGAYRTHAEPMQIVTPCIGKPHIVHYQAPDSADVPGHMLQLIDWFNASHKTKTQTMDGLVRAAVVHLWFEAIHPFEDGNGRVGRALVELALAQDLQSDVRLWSISHQMWLHRKAYYAQLQTATGQADVNVTPWVLWFVGCVERAAMLSVQHMQGALNKAQFWAHLRERCPTLSPTQIKAIDKLYDTGPDGFVLGISTQKYVNLCRVSRATAYRELTALCAWGIFVPTGTGKSTRYQLLQARISEEQS